MATKTWKIEKDLCRCCHAEGSFDNLAEPRIFLEKEEIYTDMLRGCLDIDISPVPGDLCAITYTICNACIIRLRDSCNFKKQVQDCEERFMALYYKNAIKVFNSTSEEVIKEEELDVSLVDDHPEDDVDIDFKKENSHIDDGSDEDFVAKDDEDEISDDVKETVTSKKIKNKPKSKTTKVEKTKRTRKKIKEEKSSKVEKVKKGNKEKMLGKIQPSDYKRDGDSYVCSHCDKIYCKKNSVRFHIRTHHYNKYECIHCNEQFKNITQFTVHKLTVHNIDDRISCNGCKGKFNSKVSLRKHIRVFHMLGTKYFCKLCDYETYDREGLYKHKFKHKTVKDYHCRFCKKSFIRKTNLNLHEKIHTDERNKVCKICGQAFVQKASLNYHMTKYHPEVDY